MMRKAILVLAWPAFGSQFNYSGLSVCTGSTTFIAINCQAAYVRSLSMLQTGYSKASIQRLNVDDMEEPDDNGLNNNNNLDTNNLDINIDNNNNNLPPRPRRHLGGFRSSIQ